MLKFIKKINGSIIILLYFENVPTAIEAKKSIFRFDKDRRHKEQIWMICLFIWHLVENPDARGDTSKEKSVDDLF